MRARIFAAVLLLSSIATAAEPSAEDVERARTFFNAGAQAYSSAKYDDAVRSFEQAYALAPRPPVLFSLAQAERKAFLDRADATTLRHAIAHYKEYLEKVQSGGRRSEALEAKADLEARMARMDPKETAAPAAPPRKPRVTIFSPTPGAQASFDGGPAEELPYFADLGPGKHKVRVFGEGYFDAEQEISGDKGIDVPVNLPLKEKPALVSIELAAEADVFVDGRPAATTPLTRPLEVSPGPHVIAIARNGRKSWSEEVTLERGKPAKVTPKLVTSTQRTASYVTLGVGAAALLGGTAFAIVAGAAQNNARDLEEKSAKGNLTADELDEHNRSIDRRDNFRTGSVVALSAGTALAIGGALLYLFDKPPIALVPPRSVEPSNKPVTAPSDVAVRPMVGPGIYGAGLSASF